MPSLRFLLLLAASVASAQAQAGALDRFKAFTSGLKGLDAQFQQRVYDSAGKERERSRGNVQLSAPRQFRWEVVAPLPQLIVADGRQVWIYEPDLEQVTVRSQGAEEQDSPLAVLLDPGELQRQFRTTDAGTSEGLQWLKLEPRQPEESPFGVARLGFGGGGLVRMELQDALGQRTVIDFSAWKRNPVFAGNRFAFTPPPGVDVVGEVKPPDIVTPIRD